MGIAVLSGVIDSLDAISKLQNGFPEKWESHTPGTLTPVGHSDDTSIPSRFIACVSREESARKLRHIFAGLGGLGSTVEVVAGKNLEAVQAADVVLLWYVMVYVSYSTWIARCLTTRLSAKLSCKPQLAHLILSEDGLKEALHGKLLISILAGCTMSQIKGWVLPSTRVVRAMPNTPCKVWNRFRFFRILRPNI